MADDLSDELDPQPDEEKQQVGLIAKPAPAPTGAAMQPRGLGPVAAPPASGTTEDLEQRGLASKLSPKPIAAPPSPLQARTTSAQSELGRMQATGSGISQIKNPIGRGILKTLDTIGSIAAPRIASQIPGTEMHHQQLMRQQQGRIGQDEAEETQGAALEKTGADTEEAQARAEQAGAGAEKDRAEVANAGQPKPKEEEWGVVPGMVGPDGQLVQQEKNSGQIRFAPGIAGVGPTKPTNEKPDSIEQQYAEAIARGDHAEATRLLKVKKDMADAAQKPPTPQRQLGIKDGKVVEITPGMDAGGIQSLAGEEKAGVAGQSGQDALNYANDYMAGTKFTGAGDEALMEKYFELAKPSSGFRMTQAQIEMLQHARDLMGGLTARAKHLLTPEAPYFSDEQRRQIVDTMGALEHARGGKSAGGGKDLGPAPAGKQEGATGTLPDGTKVIVKGGRMVAQ